MSSLATTNPLHPFAEFFDLISMRTKTKGNQKVEIVFVDPGDKVLENTTQTSVYHRESDEDDWGQRAIVKQLASGNQIPSPKRKNT